jgi:hypothetical protein
MTKHLLLTTMLVASLGAAACKSAGMGPETRADIQARMQSAQGPIQACYAAALKENRRIKGTLSLRLTAEASTGQFKNITVLRDEPNSKAVRTCVLEEIGKLKLEKPTSSAVQIDQAIRFAPNN